MIKKCLLASILSLCIIFIASCTNEKQTNTTVTGDEITNNVGDTEQSNNNPLEETKMDRKFSDLQTDWINGYIVIMNTIFTKVDDNIGVPVFALYKVEGKEEPLMLTGYKKEDGSGKYYVYSYEDTTLYDLGELNGTVYMNMVNNQIYVVKENGNHELYEFRDNRLWLQQTGGEMEDGFIALNTKSLVDSVVNADNIKSFIIE